MAQSADVHTPELNKPLLARLEHLVTKRQKHASQDSGFCDGSLHAALQHGSVTETLQVGDRNSVKSLQVPSGTDYVISPSDTARMHTGIGLKTPDFDYGFCESPNLQPVETSSESSHDSTERRGYNDLPTLSVSHSSVHSGSASHHSCTNSSTSAGCNEFSMGSAEESVSVSKMEDSCVDSQNTVENLSFSSDKLDEDGTHGGVINTAACDVILTSVPQEHVQMETDNQLDILDTICVDSNAAHHSGKLDDNCNMAIPAVTDSQFSGTVQDRLEDIHIQFEDETEPPKQEVQSRRKYVKAKRRSRRSMQFGTIPEAPELPAPQFAQPSSQTVPEEPCVTQVELRVETKQETQSQSTPQKNASPQISPGASSMAEEVEKLHLPFDEESEEPREIPANKRRKRGRRRSADFEIMSTAVELSPVNPEGDLPICIPSTARRSRRLKRKSIELYRTSLRAASENLHVTVNSQAEKETSADESSITRESSRTGDASPTGDDSRLMEESPASETDDSGSNSEDCATALTPIETEICEEPSVPSIHVSSASPESDGQSVSSSPKQEAQSTVVDCEQDVSDDVFDTSESKSPPKRRSRPRKSATLSVPDSSTEKRVRRPKAKPDIKYPDNVHDIYLNKLWRTQMPQLKSWETIFEAPHVSKTGGEEIIGKKK